MLKCLLRSKISLKNDCGRISKIFNASLSTQEIQTHRANIFEFEKEKQMSEIVRIEKIEVNVVENSKEHKLVMNKYLSTPLNCAMHISELHVKRSVLALVDDQPWDMNRPLEKGCTIKFLHFKDPKPYQTNLAYWRSCSFVLGSLVESAFKNKYSIDICSFPYPDLNTGSFCYDALLSIPDWKPTKEELRCLSIAATKLIRQNISFERLKIKQDIAEEMFKHNKFKLQQIAQIVKKMNDNDSLIVYKMGDFVDISQGPMISNTSLIGRFEVTGVFDLLTSSYGKIQRIQGISIPYQLRLHDWTFNLLAERASSINASQSPALNN